MAETEFTLTRDQKATLLKIARGVITARVTGAAAPAVPPPTDPQLALHLGCFVTLRVGGRLRGCIGTFRTSQPLYHTVAEMAGSALEDPRFVSQRLRPAELGQLEVEISVLSPLRRTDDPLALELGRHGIYIRQGWQSGCFLPQVATETGWSKEEFLSNCCSHKAGLPPEAWKDPKTEVHLFEALVFSEKELGSP